VHDTSGSWNREWHDCQGTPLRAHVANPAVLVARAAAAGLTDLSDERSPIWPQPPFDAPELLSVRVLTLEHAPGTEVKVYHERLFAGGGEGDYRAEHPICAFVCPRGGTPERRRCRSVADFDSVIALTQYRE
jgi:hypothetical protein